MRADGDGGGQCSLNPTLDPRPHSVSILEFGAVGDGKTLNTLAFQNAVFYLKSFADKGGAQLYVPPGKWLTGSFNLTSHLTLFLEKGAVIIGSQVFYLLLLFVTSFGFVFFTDLLHIQVVGTYDMFLSGVYSYSYSWWFLFTCHSSLFRIHFIGKLLILYLLMAEESKFLGEDIKA